MFLRAIYFIGTIVSISVWPFIPPREATLSQNSQEPPMEYRSLGKSGLKVPALSFGAGTFGGKGPLFGAWGDTDATQARRLVDLCLDAGVVSEWSDLRAWRRPGFD